MATITLTQDQLATTIQALEFSLDLDNFSRSDPHNKTIQRIIDKLKKEQK